MDKKKIISSAITIGAAGALLIGATFAFFTDTGSSSDNVFSTGTLDLQLGNGATESATFSDDVTATFGEDNMAPGDCDEVGTLSIKNAGTIGADLEMTANNTNGALTPYLRIDVLTYDGSPVAVSDDNTNTYNDLQDLATNSPVALGSLSAGEVAELTLQVCLDESAPDAVQGASNTLTLSFTLTSN